MRLRLPWPALLLLAACTGGAERTSAGSEALSRTGPSPEALEPGAPLGMTPAEPEQLLEQRADGAALYGVVLPAPRYADPDRVMALRVTGAVAGTLDGRSVLDARFAADGVVLLGTDHVLRFVDGNGAETELDAHAEGPLTVAGERIAYARGEMPFFELARVDVRTLVVEELTRDLGPVWSPALSEDGREVVFASSASGHPRWMHLDASGAIETLPFERTPSSPRAPRWVGDEITFEDEQGPATITMQSAP